MPRRINSAEEQFSKIGDIAFAAGYIHRYLQDYSASRSIPERELTEGVGKLILLPSFGELLRPEDRMSSLPGAVSERNQTMEQVEVDDRSRSTPQVVKRSYKRRVGSGRRELVPCPECGIKVGAAGLPGHLRHTHGKKIDGFMCTKCGQVFKTIQDRSRHYYREHRAGKEIAERRKSQEVPTRYTKRRFSPTALQHLREQAARARAVRAAKLNLQQLRKEAA